MQVSKFYLKSKNGILNKKPMEQIALIFKDFFSKWQPYVFGAGFTITQLEFLSAGLGVIIQLLTLLGVIYTLKSSIAKYKRTQAMKRYKDDPDEEETESGASPDGDKD